MFKRFYFAFCLLFTDLLVYSNIHAGNDQLSSYMVSFDLTNLNDRQEFVLCINDLKMLNLANNEIPSFEITNENSSEKIEIKTATQLKELGCLYKQTLEIIAEEAAKSIIFQNQNFNPLKLKRLYRNLGHYLYDFKAPLVWNIDTNNSEDLNQILKFVDRLKKMKVFVKKWEFIHLQENQIKKFKEWIEAFPLSFAHRDELYAIYNANQILFLAQREQQWSKAPFEQSLERVEQLYNNLLDRASPHQQAEFLKAQNNLSINPSIKSVSEEHLQQEILTQVKNAIDQGKTGDHPLDIICDHVHYNAFPFLKRMIHQESRPIYKKILQNSLIFNIEKAAEFLAKDNTLTIPFFLNILKKEYLD